MPRLSRWSHRSRRQSGQQRRIIRLFAMLSCSLSLTLTLSACGKDKPTAAKTATQAPPAPPPPSPLLAPAEEGVAGDPAKLTVGFVRVPGGKFMRGSPPHEAGRSPDEAQHPVSLRHDFEIQATEVTQAEYKALIGSNPSMNQICGERCPVEQVSWFEAVHYCNELSRRRKLPLCYVEAGLDITFKGVSCGGFRLPTEAEWERAARGGSAAARYGELDAIGWYDLNSSLRLHPVAQKKPNAYGLFDMIGGVFEWVWDWKAAYPKGLAIDPIGPATGQNRVFRGGAYRWTAEEARAAFRNAYGPKNKVAWIGFRCARTLP